MALRSLRTLASASLALACSVTAPLERGGGEFLTTDATAYAATQIGGDPRYARYSFTVVATITNRTVAPMYLDRCYPNSQAPIYGVELVGRSGEAAYDPIWACGGHDQRLRLMPGESRVDTLQLSGPNAFPHGGGTGHGAITGRMRLRYALQGCAGEAECRLPADAGLSNVFEVRRSR
jgi:hypothetical protein